MSNLELAWAFAFPKATAMRAQPAIVGKMLFMPVPDSGAPVRDRHRRTAVRALGVREPVPLRTSAGFGELPGSKRKVLVFGDLGANVHMVDALTGKQIWVEAVGLHPLSLTTGTPVLHEDRVYVPISQYEISLGGNDDHECCKSHGAVKALDARTGKTIWTAHTMEDAEARCAIAATARCCGSVRCADLELAGDRCEARSALRRHRRIDVRAGGADDRCGPRDRPQGRVAALGVSGDRERHLPERLRTQSQRPQLPEGNRVPRRRLRRVDDHRAALRRLRTSCLPARKPARSGRSIRTTASWCGARTSAKARRSAASTGASRTDGERVFAPINRPVRLHAAEGWRHDAEARHACGEDRHR